MKGVGGAVLMDLSKAFDTTRHGLPTATLYAFDFSKDLLQVFHNFMSNRLQRTKINCLVHGKT